MGITCVKAKVQNTFEPQRCSTLTFLVDSGVVYSMIPAKRLEKLGIQPTGQRTFFLANGKPVTRPVGEARITFHGQSATCVVLFGQKGDNTLLGVTTLENLGLTFHPMRQKIMPLPMYLADMRGYFM